MNEARALLTSPSMHSVYSTMVVMGRLQKFIETKESSKEHNEAVATLWSLVASTERHVAEHAVQTLINLSSGSLSLSSLISGLLSSSSSVVHTRALVSGLTTLLLKLDPEKTNLKLHMSSHPFIKLLKSFPSVWPQLLSQIPRFLNTSRDEDKKIIEKLVSYVLCDPNPKPHLSMFKHSLVEILLQKSLRSWSVLSQVLCSMLYGSDDVALVTEQTCLVLKITDELSSDYPGPINLLHQCILVVHAVKSDVDVGFIIDHLHNSDEEKDDDEGVYCLCAWLLVDAAFYVVSLNQLQPLLTVFVSFLLSKNIDVIVANAFLASVLRFLPRCQRIPQAVQDHLQPLLDFCNSSKSFSRNKFEDINELSQTLKTPLINCHYVHRAHFRHSLAHSMATASCVEEDDIFERLQSCSGTTSELILPSLLGFLLHHNSPSLEDSKNGDERSSSSGVVKVASLVCEKCDLSQAYIVFATLLRRLTKEREDFDLTFSLMTNLVKLTKLDEALVPTVLQLLNSSLNSRSALLPLRLRLMFDLWQIEPRVYPYLLKAIEYRPTKESSKYFRSALILAQSRVMHQLCHRRPDQLGPDLLPHLSLVLNLDEEGNLFDVECTILSLESIAKLCSERIIDVDTTLQVLENNVWCKIGRKDELKNRLRICEAMANLYEVVADLDVDEDEDESVQDLQRKVLSSLWSRLNATLVENKDLELRSFLAKVISRFHWSHHQLEMLPTYITEQLTVKHSSEDLMPTTTMNPKVVIPGEFWLLLMMEDSRAFESLVSRCIRDEIISLPRNAYYISPAMKEQGKEPGDYEYLRNEASILKAIMAIIRFKGPIGKAWMERLRSDEGETFTMLLKLLYQKEVQRHLPPLDWGKVMLEIVNPRSSTNATWANSRTGNEAKSCLLAIACLNCPTSASASRLVQSQVSAAHLVDSDLNIILNHLYNVVRGVRIASIENFLATMIDEALVEDDNNLVDALTIYLDQEMDGEYKIVVLEVLTLRLRLMFNLKEKSFKHFLPLVARMPKEAIEEALNTDNMSIVNVNNYCTLKLLKAECLTELVVCVDHVASRVGAIVDGQKELKENFISDLQRFIEDKKDQLTTEISRKWLLELMGRMRSSLRSNDKKECFEVYFDVFVTSCQQFAGCHLQPNVSLGLCLSTLFVSDETNVLKKENNHGLTTNPVSTWSSLAPALCEWMDVLMQTKLSLSPRIFNIVKQTSFSFLSCKQQYREDSMWTRLLETEMEQTQL